MPTTWAVAARFRIEAEITGALEHPGIVPVYGLGTYGDGRPYYAMRFVRGDSLKEAIERFHAAALLKADPGLRSLELRKLLRRFVDICNAIDYAHSRGVLHRDIKPGNIIVGRYGETLVVDWGLAKATGLAEPGSAEGTLVPVSASGSAETLPGSAMGTPAYMSPEQAEGQLDRLGPHSDVYSLGATLYCLLTGRAPFERDNVADVIRAVQKGDFPPPRTLAPAIDRPLEAVCLKSMAKEPADRYSSCRALAEDIERWMADEPVTAWRDPFTYRMRRWAKRNRTAVTAAVAALLVGVIGLGSVAGVQARANKKLQYANSSTNKALDDTRLAQRETQLALRQSEESRKQAEAVSSFLVEAFRSPDPSQDGKEIKVAEVLDRATRRLDWELSGSEATRGALLDALGRTYMGLGLTEMAVRLLEQAGQVRETALGPDHPDTLHTRIHTIYLYADHAGRANDAVVLGEAMLKRCDSKLPPDHPDTLACRHHLAVAYYSSGRLVDAIQMGEEALRCRQLTLEPDDPSILDNRSDVAVFYYTAGRTADAIRMDEETLKMRERKLGPHHPDTLTSAHNLANAYEDAGRNAEAIRLHEETLKRSELRLGADHPDTLKSRDGLAGAYLADHRVSEAMLLYEGTLKLRERKLGPEHPDTLVTRSNVATVYHELGRYAEASEQHEATLNLSESKLGHDHPLTLKRRNFLASAYLHIGRTRGIVEITEATLKLCESKLGIDHPDTLYSCDNLANAYLAVGRYSDAIALRDRTIKVRTLKQGPNHPDTLNGMHSLAWANELVGNWTSAAELRRDALTRRRESVKPHSPMLTSDLSALGRNLLKRQRWSEAEPLLREGLAIATKAIPDSWRRFHAMSVLGGALVGKKSYAEAEPLVVEGFDGLRKREPSVPAGSRIIISEAAERIVDLYDSWGKREVASQWRTKLGLGNLPRNVFAQP